MLKLTKDYLDEVRQNKSYRPWGALRPFIVDDIVKVVNEALQDYPEFYHASPSHYTESNIIYNSIEGHTTIKIDCESFTPLKKLSKLFLRTLFRWMFNQEFKGVFESNFKLSEQKSISSYQT